MKYTSHQSRKLYLLCTLLVCTGWSLLFFGGHFSKHTVAASPPLQATPTCPATNCPQARAYGYQPERYSMRSAFNNAAKNTLGSSSPPYDQIKRGTSPVTTINVSNARPLPHSVLRGMAWQESHWLQFANSVGGSDNTSACTFLSGDCGYGLMQITSCMTDGCNWFTPSRVAGEWQYNLGTGTNFLIQKWNGTSIPFISDNDHTEIEQLYYAVTAYNGWSTLNDPNNNIFDPRRPPYGEGNYSTFTYPYQELIWGWMGHPENASVGLNWLWRPTQITTVPRGIFGLGADWKPPASTSKPIFHLLQNVRFNNGTGPSIVLQNTTNQILAIDVMFYNTDHSFNRRWLDITPNPPWFRQSYIRLDANTSRTLSLANAFTGENFNGYARISASEGIEVSLQPPNYLHKVFLPGMLKNNSDNCYQAIQNGGFEDFVEGQPEHWTIFSTDGYSLADSTWFNSGHNGAYLGGYDLADDILKQTISIPSNATLATLSYQQYMRTEETTSGQFDFLYTKLYNTNGSFIATLDTQSDEGSENVWQSSSFDLLSYKGQALQVWFKADLDITQATSFFVDNVSLWICQP